MGQIAIFSAILGDFRGRGKFVFFKGKPGSLEETVLGVSSRRPENTFPTLVKHSWAF